MDTIPSTYWMIIIGAVTLMICFVLYYLAMLLKETKEAVTDSRGIIKQAEKSIKQLEIVVNDLQQSLSTIRNTVDEVNQAILAPIRKIGYGITLVSSFLSRSKKEE